jgi:hypothetical protein
VDKIPVDVDAKDWASDDSVETELVFSIKSDSSIGTCTTIPVTFSVSSATSSNGMLICPGFVAGICDHVIEDLDFLEYVGKICICPFTGRPLPNSEEHVAEFKATLEHSSRLPKHKFGGMTRGRDMATIPSLSVSSS